MTKIILLFLLSSLHYSCNRIEASVNAAGEDKNTVYICDSRGGKRYHLKENCRGLSNCRAKVIKVSQSDAMRQGKTLCGWEKK